MTSTVGADEHQAAEEPGVAHLVAALVGQVRREHEQRRELGELCGLEVERSEVERDAVLAGHLPDQEQQREHHERQAVEEPRPVLQPLVVDRHDGEHHDRRGDREHDLPRDEGVRVTVHLRARRRVDDRAPHHRQHSLRQQQHPVDVATRVALARADVAESPVGLALQERERHGITPAARRA
jgi:hypothetical protein